MSVTRIRLKPADSFDLIRLLARSQNDPRKAVCELVQNSLDAGARNVQLTWFNEKGTRALRVRDDGSGIFPELPRDEALRKIATTIGHSHKRDLTPAQRRELMALGKYGIGLLGFWSVGKVLQIRSRVVGGEVRVLRLREESAEAELASPKSQRLDEEPNFTDVTILGVHDEVARQIRPGRLQAYLASELRGQLLDREVWVRIHDRVARGRSVKEFVVTAQRFRGRPIPELTTLSVPGHEDARVELYMVGVDEERIGKVLLSCGGTTVLDDMADVDGTGELRAPWSSGRLEGVVDFPELDVAPGTRRGFARNAAAAAFVAALPPLEEKLRALLAEEDRRREEERDKNVAREIRRAFRDILRRLPEYDLFEVPAGGETAVSGAAPTGEAVGKPEDVGEQPEVPEPAVPVLYPPGPLAAVRIAPARNRIPCNAPRTLRARALDADGRAAAGDVAFTWRLEGPGEIAAGGASCTYSSPAYPAAASVHVEARQEATRVECVADVVVVEDYAGAGGAAGIPEPVGIHAPGEQWRSRVREGVWEYNTGHADYVTASATEARRLRYLIHLFAKEVVLRSFGSPADALILERMVQIITHLDDGRVGGRGSAGSRQATQPAAGEDEGCRPEPSAPSAG